MSAKLIKGLALTFSLTALGGCATMDYTGTQDCVQRSGFALNAPLLAINKRNDTFNEACATARAATAISGMKRSDGTPDMNMYNLAVSMYEQSNPKVREFMDKMLAEEGTSINEMKFALDKTSEPTTCERVTTTRPDGTETSGFKCTVKAKATAVTAAPAAR
ncbi:MAG: hypothetical protein PW788_07650 [Micavibrio sp.]|nr:hypothetical protein [Micavibrio sp.]